MLTTGYSTNFLTWIDNMRDQFMYPFSFVLLKVDIWNGLLVVKWRNSLTLAQVKILLKITLIILNVCKTVFLCGRNNHGKLVTSTARHSENVRSLQWNQINGIR